MLIHHNMHSTLQHTIIRGVLEMLLNNQSPEPHVWQSLFTLLADGALENIEVAALLTLMRVRGETSVMLEALVQSLRQKMIPLTAPAHAVDCCGTGGDGQHTLNISTAAAIVAAGAGLTVVKHGNRAVSSRSGSADVLEALGVRTDMDAQESAYCLAHAGITFAAAPKFHPAMRYVSEVRRTLGFRTIFNMVGPLLNPAGVKRQLIGVYSPDLLPMMTTVLHQTGTHKALLVHGHDGSDEISASHPTTLVELQPDGSTTSRVFVPQEVGFDFVDAQDLRGGDAEQNAMAIHYLLQGEASAYRQAVVLNAGALLYIADAAETIQQGVQKAQKSIDSGAALSSLAAFADHSHIYGV